MAVRVEVAFKPEVRDSLGEKVKRRILTDLGIAVDSVRTVEVYTIDAALSPQQLHAVAEESLRDTIVQDVAVGRPIGRDFDWLIEVGFKPGVTDNVGRTAKESVELQTGHTFEPQEGVYTSRQYLIRGSITFEDARRIADQLLANDLIQRTIVVSRDQWSPERGVGVFVPRVRSDEGIRVEEIDLELSDAELMRISQDRVLALSLRELKAIRNYLRLKQVQSQRAKVGLGKRVTDVELECLAQTWSEHCKHKIFNALIRYCDEKGRVELIDGLFKTYIRGATEEIRRRPGQRDLCLSVFTDNAGVISFNENWNLVMKVETHNSPSALDPYGGALTGIVGVNRDPFGTGKGARLIFNTDVFCFASPFYSRPLPPRLLHPRRIYEGVREGVEHGGNKSGIPTVNGSIVFDDRFLGKPLVFCGTGGIMLREILGELSHIKEALPGDWVVMCGGRIGKDGIHGATFSSEELHEGSPATAVQIGDPITQKRMTDFLLEARDRGLYRCITDNGAGGLSSSVGEMSRDPGGAELHLERAPLKYSGLYPWEILLSEAQERMTLAVQPECLEEFIALARLMSVEATVLGTFNDEKRFHIYYQGRTAGCLDMDFLHEGVPRMRLYARWRPPRRREPRIPLPDDLGEVLERMLSRLNICSKETVVRQYDHEVQGGSVVKPLVGVENDGPGDAAVFRVLLDSLEGVVVAHGICPRYSDIDTYWMMANAIDEAVRNAVSVGADPERLAGLDNFCWCDPIKSEKTPDGHYKLAQLVRANKALYDFTTAYGVPCISGKDSMKNDSIIEGVKISIPPTVLFSVLGRMDDVRRAVSMDVKQEGHLVYVVGLTRAELGGSEYFAMHEAVGNAVPRVDASMAIKIFRALHSAIKQSLVASCHDCSDGGLGVALAESAFAGGLGMAVNLASVPSEGIKRDDFLLFSESASRFVVSVPPHNRAEFERTMVGVPCGMVGTVDGSGRLKILCLNGRSVVDADLGRLKEAWKRPLMF